MMSAERRFEYLNSPLNFTDYTSTITMFLWNLDDFVKRSKNAGFTGLEMTPLKLPRVRTDIKDGISFESRIYVQSIEQSYLSERNIFEALSKPGLKGKAVATASYILLPERYASLADITEIQNAVGQDIPVILYPENTKAKNKSMTSKLYGKKLFQPTGEIMENWDSRNISDMTHIYPDYGYDGLAVALYHGRRDYRGLMPLRTDEDLDIALQHSSEIHVEMGRVDIKSPVDTVKELGDIYYGNYTSQMADMLKQIGKHQTNGKFWRGRVKVEVPYPTLCQVAGVSRTDRHLNFDNTWNSLYSRLNTNIAKLLEA